MRTLKISVLFFILLAACVQQEDLDAWEGQPASLLDAHPFFNTLPVETKIMADGTEIRNYVNGVCENNYSDVSINIAINTSSTIKDSCAGSFMACNNQFYIKDGRVIAYAPVGSGGARCRTDERVRPRIIGG